MFRRIVTVILVVALSALLLVFVWPQMFGLESAPVIAQIVALRGLDVAIALAAVVVLLLLAAVRPIRRLAVALAVPLAVFVVASLVILGVRGFGGGTSLRATSDITVLSWNTKGAAPGAADIAKLALAQHADVIALPETTQQVGVSIAGIMKAAGRPMWVLSATHGNVYRSHATTLLVSSALGSYKVADDVGDTSISSTVVAKADNGTSPTLIAVHAVSPKPQEMRNWRSDLNYLSTICTGSNLIMAGDFNATLDHLRSLSTRSGADFGGCTDAGGAAGAAAVGSWPSNLPTMLGAQIDHVMYGSGWKIGSMHVITSEDAAGSDHRPIVATLVPVG
jgi:endonuclease/exonuclease/phosphatase (EEP) superfamily protein YafD